MSVFIRLYDDTSKSTNQLNNVIKQKQPQGPIMTSGIYKIENISNQKFYIGSSKNIENRFNMHLSQLRRGCHHNTHLQRSFDKYGEDKFKLEIVQIVKPDCLLTEESKYIDQLSPHYNMGPVGGGDTFQGISEDARNERIKKMSASSKRMWVRRSPEWLSYWRERNKGEGNPNFNNTWSDAARSLQSNKLKLRYRNNPEAKEHISRKKKVWWALRTKEQLEDFKEKRKIASTGEKNPFYGKTHTQETRKKMSIARKKECAAMTDEEYEKKSIPIFINGVRYRSITEASSVLEEPMSSIYRRLKSSNFTNYYAESVSFEYKPVVKNVYILKLTSGEETWFAGGQNIASFTGLSKTTIDRFIKNGIHPENRFYGCEISFRKVWFTMTHPHSTEL